MTIALILAGLLCPVTAAGSAPSHLAQTPLAQTAAVQIRVGGYRPAEVADAGVQAAAQFAAQSVEGELEEIHEAQQQVVAGMNYQLSFSTTDGRHFTAIVYRALNGAYKVTRIEEADVPSAEEHSPEEAASEE